MEKDEESRTLGKAYFGEDDLFNVLKMRAYCFTCDTLDRESGSLESGNTKWNLP